MTRSRVRARRNEGLSAFDRHVAPIFERRHRLDEESRALAAQRDALLPRLVSGKLRLGEFMKAEGQ